MAVWPRAGIVTVKKTIVAPLPASRSTASRTVRLATVTFDRVWMSCAESVRFTVFVVMTLFRVYVHVVGGNAATH
jgi:hypothetical protein